MIAAPIACRCLIHLKWRLAEAKSRLLASEVSINLLRQMELSLRRREPLAPSEAGCERGGLHFESITKIKHLNNSKKILFVDVFWRIRDGWDHLERKEVFVLTGRGVNEKKE